MTITATVDDVMSWGPCPRRYPRARVEQLWAGRAALTLEQFLALPIPAEDLNWGALQPYWLGDTDLRSLCGELIKSRLQVFEAKFPDEPRPRQFLVLLKQYLNGTATAAEVKAAVQALKASVQDDPLPQKVISFLRACVGVAWAVDDDDDAPEPKDVARAVWAHLRNSKFGNPGADVQTIRDFLRNLP